MKKLLLSYLLLALTGCTKVTMLRTEELRKVEAEVKTVHTQVADLQKSLDDLNINQGGTSSKMKADLTLMLGQLESQLTRLHAEIDETQYRLNQLSAKVDKLDQKKIVIGNGGTPAPGTGPAAPGTPGASAAPGQTGAAGTSGAAGENVRVVEGLD